MNEQSEQATTLICLCVYAAERVGSELAGSFCTSEDRELPQSGHDMALDSTI
jgi:hypothetical protein